MSLEANKQLVRDFMKHFSEGDLTTALGMMTDDATWWVAGSFPLSGTKTKAQFAELLGQIGAMVPGGIRLTPKAFTAEGDRVAVETESYARHTNGKVYQNQYHFLIEVRGGKIGAVREYLDTMHANDVFCS
ncbi:MAG: nuclear transport factor 2 family protein [Deltaproteobacteria bacterium]|nr:nuclear transport factor 2 family protein [Deltaproteobacteria bacterium]